MAPDTASGHGVDEPPFCLNQRHVAKRRNDDRLPEDRPARAASRSASETLNLSSPWRMRCPKLASGHFEVVLDATKFDSSGRRANLGLDFAQTILAEKHLVIDEEGG